MTYKDYMDFPEIAKPIASQMVTKTERYIIEFMKNDSMSYKNLSLWIYKNIEHHQEDLIQNMYFRGIVNKEIIDNQEFVKVASFWDRLSYFCQYENDLWLKVDSDVRRQIDDLFVERYAINAKERLIEVENGTREHIENAFLFTLDETLELIDDLDKDIYVVPCNCRSIADNCDKPRNVCLLFETHINSEWDRGRGKVLTKEEAKAIVKEADKKGLMHTSETDQAICNCCGDCCYPIRASEKIGYTGQWPKRRYDIVWDEDKCIHCGKCAKICNFDAFNKEDKKVSFDEDKCIGCTICSNHCPVGAISLKKL